MHGFQAQLAGTSTVTASTFSGNSAGWLGGGIDCGGALTVATSTFSGNLAQAGGAISNGGTLSVVNSTLADNSAYAGGGGGIFNQATLTVVNSTIAYNGATDGGGGIFDSEGTATLDNTIVAANTEGSGLGALAADITGSPVFGTSAYNLVGVDNTESLSASNDNLLNIRNPGLGALGNNGGPTQTIALLAGSPAIDAGNNALAVDPTTGDHLAYDQRGTGYPRVVGASVDIGAFERPTVIGSPTMYTVNLTSASGAGSGNAGDLVYVIGQADANANLAGSVIAFDSTVFASAQTITLSSTLQLSEPSGPLVIVGPGAGLATISVNNAVGVLQVTNGSVVTVSRLTISGGSASDGGGILNLDWGTLTVSGSTLSGNSASNDGGGIASGGFLTVSGSTLSGNSASVNGGGIYNVETLAVTGSSLSGASAGVNGGGIFNAATMTVTTSTLSGNSAAGGGGICNVGSLTVSGSTLSGNSAAVGGGIFNDQTLTVGGSTLSGNSASDYGGGIYNVGTLTVNGSTIADNTAYLGGGI